ncbi:hypothetical protein HNQ08_004455 [Deinococcus humi]|uniref:Uncharacterized protein n=1 Tax=Deinococcus humi TaxID=662880 RepID=A0A7W8K163_9DEIO|nr:hypothetical protein [Deinococcus humi]
MIGDDRLHSADIPKEMLVLLDGPVTFALIGGFVDPLSRLWIPPVF